MMLCIHGLESSRERKGLRRFFETWARLKPSSLSRRNPANSGTTRFPATLVHAGILDPRSIRNVRDPDGRLIARGTRLRSTEPGLDLLHRLKGTANSQGQRHQRQVQNCCAIQTGYDTRLSGNEPCGHTIPAAKTSGPDGAPTPLADANHAQHEQRLRQRPVPADQGG